MVTQNKNAKPYLDVKFTYFVGPWYFLELWNIKKVPRKTISIYTDLKTVEIILLIEKGIHMDTPKSHRTMNNSLSSFSHIYSPVKIIIF